MKKHLPLLMLLLMFGCKPSTSTTITISSINNQKSINITGFDPAIINDISRDSSSTAWQTLMAVYRMPADSSLINQQPVQPGQYKVVDNVVVFTPDTAFDPQKTYFLRYYNFEAGTSLTDLIKSHSKPGSLHYTDLTFKH